MINKFHTNSLLNMNKNEDKNENENEMYDSNLLKMIWVPIEFQDEYEYCVKLDSGKFPLDKKIQNALYKYEFVIGFVKKIQHGIYSQDHGKLLLNQFKLTNHQKILIRIFYTTLLMILFITNLIYLLNGILVHI